MRNTGQRTRNLKSLLIPAAPSPGTEYTSFGEADSFNQRTPDSCSSIRALFYERPQAPVDALDVLQVIGNSLEALAASTAGREHFRVDRLEEARNYILEARDLLCTLSKVPKRYEPQTVANFAAFLQKQIALLFNHCFDLTNLTDPFVEQGIEKLNSYLRSQ